MAELPEQNEDGTRRPRNEASTALYNIDQAASELSAAETPKAVSKANAKHADNLKRLLSIHAEFGQPARSRMPEEPQTKQTMTARVTVMVPPPTATKDEEGPPAPRTPLEMAGNVPRGTGQRRPRGSGYELFNPDERLPPESSNKPRGGVYTDTNAPNTSKVAQQREVVTRGWAAGGEAYRRSNTGHTESQFDLFLERQGTAFRERIVAIEIHSTLSPCSSCTDMLIGIRRTLDEERAPIDPNNPAGPNIATAVLTFAYSEPYQPGTKKNQPDRQAAQTRPSDLTKLASARWIVSGPPLNLSRPIVAAASRAHVSFVVELANLVAQHNFADRTRMNWRRILPSLRCMRCEELAKGSVILWCDVSEQRHDRLQGSCRR